MTREPGDLPERGHPSGARGARMERCSAVVTIDWIVTRTEDRHVCLIADFCEWPILVRAQWEIESLPQSYSALFICIL